MSEVDGLTHTRDALALSTRCVFGQELSAGVEFAACGGGESLHAALSNDVSAASLCLHKFAQPVDACVDLAMGVAAVPVYSGVVADTPAAPVALLRLNMSVGASATAANVSVKFPGAPTDAVCAVLAEAATSAPWWNTSACLTTFVSGQPNRGLQLRRASMDDSGPSFRRWCVPPCCVGSAIAVASDCRH